MPTKQTTVADEATRALGRIVGDILRERRKKLGYRQIDLVEEGQIDRSYISKIERGISLPGLKAILHLEKVLEMEPGEFTREVTARLTPPKK